MSQDPVVSRTARWEEHYRRQHATIKTSGLAKSISMSNERVVFQTYAHLLEGVGDVHDRSVLDAGCGWGTLSLILRDLGAKVTAIDLVSETIETLRIREPGIGWQVMDMTDEVTMSALPSFDCIVTVEALQHMDFKEAVISLWGHVKPGGMLVGSIPNSECPIVRKVENSSDGLWTSVSQSRIRDLVLELPDFADLHLKGLAFRQDQSFLPYIATDWGSTVDGTPNRLLFAIIRRT